MDLEEKIALNIARDLSDDLCEKITSKTIRWMQGFDTQLLEIDGLKNLWDDVCYQMQRRESFTWSHYDDMVVSNIVSLLEELEGYKLTAIWLQTNDVYSQISDLESDGLLVGTGYKTIDASSYIDDITKYITGKYIYQQAESWRNDRLRQALGYFPGD